MVKVEYATPRTEQIGSVAAMVETHSSMESPAAIMVEMIFEVKDEKVDEFGLKIAKIMSEIVSLNVPLVVNYNVAKNWGELK